MALQAGLNASFVRTVCANHTAVAHDSGDVDVLATPKVLAWCEEATMAVLDGRLGAGETSVGMRVRLDHVRPTPVGASVTVAAELSRVEGRRLTFEVTVADPDGEIAHGQVIRVIVDRDRFMGRARAS